MEGTREAGEGIVKRGNGGSGKSGTGEGRGFDRGEGGVGSRAAPDFASRLLTFASRLCAPGDVGGESGVGGGCG